ncbi:DnaJ domain-containing protein [Coemansia spiralis]|nr:DnaJ domain-containing protein [Coemansia spiralis]
MSREALFGLADDEQVPDLYVLLEVSKEATEDELRKAYRKRALHTHPDKWAHLDSESPEALAKTQEFQQVGFAYSILKDPKRRKLYDTTGSVSDIIDIVEEGKDWNTYFRELWSGVVDATTIEQFAKTYKGSDEEMADILAAYSRHDGDIDLIFTEVMLADVEQDEARFIAAIEDAIKGKLIKRTRAFTKSKKRSSERIARVREEAAEADALRKELGLDEKLRKVKADRKAAKRKRSDAGHDDSDDGDASDGTDIKTLIRQRTNSRMFAIIANIEEKYASQSSKGKKSKGKKSTKASSKPKKSAKLEEPSEEEFMALQAKLFGKK